MKNFQATPTGFSLLFASAISLRASPAIPLEINLAITFEFFATVAFGIDSEGICLEIDYSIRSYISLSILRNSPVISLEIRLIIPLRIQSLITLVVPLDILL